MPELLKDLRQRQLEDYEEQLNTIAPGGIVEVKGKARIYGTLLRAAVRAGWYGPDYGDEQVDALSFAEVEEMATAVADLYSEFTAVSD